MNTTLLWIIIAVILLLLIIVGIVVIGNNRKKSKTVSFEKKEEEQPKELTQQEKSGNYQAKGGFNFAPANAPEQQPEPVLRDDQTPPAAEAAEAPESFETVDRTPKEAPVEPPKPEVTEDSQRNSGASQAVAGGAAGAAVAGAAAASAGREEEPTENEPAEAAPAEVEGEPVKIVDEAEPEKIDEPAQAEVAEADTPEPESSVSEEGVKIVEETEPESAEESPSVASASAEQPETVVAPVADTPEVDDADEQAPLYDDLASNQAGDDSEGIEENLAHVDEIEAQTQTPEEEAQEAAEAAQVTAGGVDEALEQTPVPEGEPAPAPEPLDDIEPASGRIGRLRGRLSRSQNAIGQGLLGILTAGDLDEDAWEEIEDTLIMADLGADLTMKVTDSLRDKIAERGVSSEEEARAMLRETLIEAGRPELDRSIKAMPSNGKPAVILVVGVNGTGKTTTTGKLGRVLVSMGHKVLFGAADTFRAAAADQLETWGKRVGATTVRGAEGADPASVAFDAVATGVEEQADVVLVDTAGRLHTATGLMDQLGKVKRVVEKKSQVDEVLLVLDATVGQNGLTQARVFRDVVDITGVVLTKLDGTAKGGIVFQVQEELGVPVKLVGLGEGADDLAPFEVEGFVDALLG